MSDHREIKDSQAGTLPGRKCSSMVADAWTIMHENNTLAKSHDTGQCLMPLSIYRTLRQPLPAQVVRLVRPHAANDAHVDHKTAYFVIR